MRGYYRLRTPRGMCQYALSGAVAQILGKTRQNYNGNNTPSDLDRPPRDLIDVPL